MPKRMNYPKALFVRVAEDVPERIIALADRTGEPITSVQRRVIQAGLEALEAATALDAAEQAPDAAGAKRTAGRRGATDRSKE